MNKNDELNHSQSIEDTTCVCRREEGENQDTRLEKKKYGIKTSL